MLNSMSAQLKTQDTTSSPEMEICPYIHDSFPPGRKIGSPTSGQRERRNFRTYRSQTTGVTNRYDDRMNWYQTGRKERSMDLTFPQLNLDNSPAYKKNTNCSFINNHKHYLKIKGFDLNHVYSLKRNHGQNVLKGNNMRNSKALKAKLTPLSKSDLDLTAVISNDPPISRRGSTQRDSVSVWKPDDSRKLSSVNIPYSQLIQGLGDQAKTPGPVRVGYLTSNRLGNVMTKTHLRSLLAQEEPTQLNTFYKKSRDYV